MTPATTLPLRDRFLFSLTLYASVMTMYFAAGMMARGPLVSLRTPLDDAIPFVPAAMVGYALVYLLPFSLLWLEDTADGYRRMTRAAILAYAMAVPFFIVMPVLDADPPLQAVTWTEHLLEWNRQADTSKNAFPSMHVGLATLLALIGARRSLAWGLGLGACAVVIAVSTLLVKQHFLADLPSGALVGYIAYRLAGRPEPQAEAVEGEA